MKKLICKLAHCKCMNLGGNCPNHHYSDSCFEEDVKAQSGKTFKELTCPQCGIFFSSCVELDSLIRKVEQDTREATLKDIMEEVEDMRVPDAYVKKCDTQWTTIDSVVDIIQSKL